MDRVHDAIEWYQKKIGSYDKQLWEQSVEKKLQKQPSFVLHNAPRRKVRIKTEFIDVDLIRGSTFTKTKPQVPWVYVTKKALARVIFFPFYYSWWIHQTSKRVYALLLCLYALQVLSLGLYAFTDDSIFDDELSFTEVVLPMILMFLLCLIHSQTVLAHVTHKPPKHNKPISGVTRKPNPRPKKASRKDHNSGGNSTCAEDGGHTDTSKRSGGQHRKRRSPLVSSASLTTSSPSHARRSCLTEPALRGGEGHGEVEGLRRSVSTSACVQGRQARNVENKVCVNTTIKRPTREVVVASSPSSSSLPSLLTPSASPSVLRVSATVSNAPVVSFSSDGIKHEEKNAWSGQDGGGPRCLSTCNKEIRSADNMDFEKVARCTVIEHSSELNTDKSRADLSDSSMKDDLTPNRDSSLSLCETMSYMCTLLGNLPACDTSEKEENDIRGENLDRLCAENNLAHGSVKREKSLQNGDSVESLCRGTDPNSTIGSCEELVLESEDGGYSTGKQEVLSDVSGHFCAEKANSFIAENPMYLNTTPAKKDNKVLYCEQELTIKNGDESVIMKDSVLCKQNEYAAATYVDGTTSQCAESHEQSVQSVCLGNVPSGSINICSGRVSNNDEISSDRGEDNDKHISADEGYSFGSENLLVEDSESKDNICLYSGVDSTVEQNSNSELELCEGVKVDSRSSTYYKNYKSQIEHFSSCLVNKILSKETYVESQSIPSHLNISPSINQHEYNHSLSSVQEQQQLKHTASTVPPQPRLNVSDFTSDKSLECVSGQTTNQSMLQTPKANSFTSHTLTVDSSHTKANSSTSHTVDSSHPRYLDVQHQQKDFVDDSNVSDDEEEDNNQEGDEDADVDDDGIEDGDSVLSEMSNHDSDAEELGEERTKVLRFKGKPLQSGKALPKLQPRVQSQFTTLLQPDNGPAHTSTYLSSQSDMYCGATNTQPCGVRQRSTAALARKLSLPGHAFGPSSRPVSGQEHLKLAGVSTPALLTTNIHATESGNNKRTVPQTLDLRDVDGKHVSSSENEAGGGNTPEGSNKAAVSSEEWEDRIQTDDTTSSAYSSSCGDSGAESGAEGEAKSGRSVDYGEEKTEYTTSTLHVINLLQPQSGSPSNSGSNVTQSDRVSCLIWEGNECKKVDLTALDIGWAIIDKVDSLPESSDYFLIGFLFSVIIGLVPLVFRAYSNKSSLKWEDLTSLAVLVGHAGDIPSLMSSVYTWRQWVLLVNSVLQRFCLSLCFFFLLSVADRTFKQRLLYAKHFSYLTSSRRARKFTMPHFRLSKVRNIKIWLSLRSYLKRRGPQRSVDVIVSACFICAICTVSLISLQMLKDSESYLEYLCNWELLVWCVGLAIFLMRFMTVGLKINKKYRNLSVLITEQINLYLQMEQKPHKKDQLILANNVLRLAEDLLKELESPFKISGFSANPVIYNIMRVVVLSAFSAVLTEVLGFKLKLHKIKLKG